MPNFISPLRGHQLQNRLSPIAFNDLTVSYNLPWKGHVQVGVHNIFDRQMEPEFYGVSHPPFEPSYDIDRYLFVAYSQKF